MGYGFGATKMHSATILLTKTPMAMALSLTTTSVLPDSICRTVFRLRNRVAL